VLRKRVITQSLIFWLENELKQLAEDPSEETIIKIHETFDKHEDSISMNLLETASNKSKYRKYQPCQDI